MRLFSASLALAACLASFAFADEANVLPEGVMRLRLVPSQSTTDKAYDDKGSKVDTNAKGVINAMSGALEFGVLKPVTLGLKWAPGYFLTSDLTNPPAALAAMNKKATYGGPADLEIGAKIQVLGPLGYVPNESFRFALTPGFSLPLDKFDGKKEFENFSAGKAYRLQTSSGHSAPGVGIKGDLDYFVIPSFYLNLHGQAFQYFSHEEIGFAAYATNAMTYAGYLQTVYSQALAATGNAATATAIMNSKTADAAAYANLNAPLTKTKTTYGAEYAVEFEPHYTIDLGNSSNIGLGLPVTYSVVTPVTTVYNAVETKSKTSTLTVVKPYVTGFFLVGPLPLEVQAEYDLPLAGKDENATGTLSCQVKLFYKFY